MTKYRLHKSNSCSTCVHGCQEPYEQYGYCTKFKGRIAYMSRCSCGRYEPDNWEEVNDIKLEIECDD